jgi:hypothetical protein
MSSSLKLFRHGLKRQLWVVTCVVVELSDDFQLCDGKCCGFRFRCHRRILSVHGRSIYEAQTGRSESVPLDCFP